MKPENLRCVSSRAKGDDTCALRDAVIYYNIRQTTIALCRNALVVDTTNEKRRKEYDEAHGAVTILISQ